MICDVPSRHFAQLSTRPSYSPGPLQMRRVAFQAFRSARRPCLRKLARSRTAPFFVSNGLHVGPRHLPRSRFHALPSVLTSSMQLRAFTGALVAAVAGGAFYAYQGSSPDHAATSSAATAADQLRNTHTDAAEPTRRALVVDQVRREPVTFGRRRLLTCAGVALHRYNYRQRSIVEGDG